jgi:hypothetical protein
MPAVPPELPAQPPPSVVIGKAQPSPTQLRAQDAILFHQVRNHVPFLTSQPANQNREPHLERRHVDHRPESISQGKTSPSLVLNRAMGHFDTDEGGLRALLPTKLDPSISGIFIFSSTTKGVACAQSAHVFRPPWLQVIVSYSKDSKRSRRSRRTSSSSWTIRTRRMTRTPTIARSTSC